MSYDDDIYNPYSQDPAFVGYNNPFMPYDNGNPNAPMTDGIRNRQIIEEEEEEFLQAKAEYENAIINLSRRIKEDEELLYSIVKQRNFLFKEGVGYRYALMEAVNRFGSEELKEVIRDTAKKRRKEIEKELLKNEKFVKQGFNLKNLDEHVKERYKRYFGRLD